MQKLRRLQYQKQETQSVIIEGLEPSRYGKPLELLTDHGSQFYANFG